VIADLQCETLVHIYVVPCAVSWPQWAYICLVQESNAGPKVRRIECQVMQSNISRSVAGIWSIWFLWSVSFDWFDEPERQDRPAHQIDCL
jgi:hypothetical protein